MVDPSQGVNSQPPVDPNKPPPPPPPPPEEPPKTEDLSKLSPFEKRLVKTWKFSADQAKQFTNVFIKQSSDLIKREMDRMTARIKEMFKDEG